jgi:hypothetical protein
VGYIQKVTSLATEMLLWAFQQPSFFDNPMIISVKPLKLGKTIKGMSLLMVNITMNNPISVILIPNH